jgi:hypothetical protein
VEFARQLLSQSPAEVTPIVGVLHTSALIFDLVPKLQLFTTCEKDMDINSHKNGFYNAQYQEAILKYVANKYCAKHRYLPIIEPRCVPNNTLFTSTIVSGSSQSSFHPYHLFSDFGDGFEGGLHVGWYSVELGGATCTIVLVYVSIRLSKSQ